MPNVIKKYICNKNITCKNSVNMNANLKRIRRQASCIISSDKDEDNIAIGKGAKRYVSK